MTTNPSTAVVAPAPAAEPIKPIITEINRAFWDGCKNGQLLAQRCKSCGQLRYPAAAICQNCLSADSEWRDLSGRGEIFSFIIVHRGYHPYWAVRVPYNVAMIELEEGLRMFSNIVGTPNEQLKIGQMVKVAFEERAPGLTVPVFELDGGQKQ